MPRTVSERFTVDDLSRVRGLVEEASRAAALPARRTGDLVVAVNELVVNAVLYAGGGGRVTVTASVEGVTVEVADEGPGLPAGMVVGERPAADALSGRGLWMALRLFPNLSIQSSSRGVTVRIFTPTG